MPKKITLERVQTLASQLSAEDRLELFGYLAKLPDNTLIYYPPVSEPRSLVLPSNPTQEVLALNTQLGWSLASDGTHSFSVEGREVLRIKFNPENYSESTFEQLKDKALQFTATGDGRDKLRGSISEYIESQGMTATEEEIDRIEKESLQQYSRKVLREAITKLAGTIDDNMSQVAIAVLAKIVQAAGFSVANLLHDTLRMPEAKLKASDVQSIIYKPEWDRLKTIIGLQSTHGGKRNVKHDWSDAELDCLAKAYQELAPVWLEAKQIARAAQNSRVGSRSKSWRDEVLRAFPDLPAELLDRLKHLRADDAKPSDIALVHAKIKCGVTETYSARELRDKIKSRNLKPKSRTSAKSHKTRKFKTKT